MNIEQEKFGPISDDDFQPGEHEALDAVIKNFVTLTDENVTTWGPHVLVHIVDNSKGRLVSTYSDRSNARKLIQEEETFRNMMIDGSKSGFKCVRLCKYLRQTGTYIEALRHTEPTSAEKGWDEPFRGDAADALWKHICHFFPQPDAPAANPSKHDRREYYALYCAILQSSGMGKSRAVDQLSENHLVIPVVLRMPDSTGHPPSDQPACDYLSQSSNKRDAFIRSCAFLHALFDEVAAVVRSFKNSPAAASFREYMRKDMKFKKHGENRVQFYQKVVITAEKYVTSTYDKYFHRDVDPSDDHTDNLLHGHDFPLHLAFHELCEALQAQDPSKPPPSKRPKLPAEPRAEPLVLIAFDEIHTLAKTYSHSNNPWSRFGELRRAIRGLLCEPFFALFLSTSGAAFAVTPAPARDVSARMIHRGDVMLPFCELGFDPLATRLDFSQSVSLSKVTSLDHLVSYGRPLWKSYQHADNTVIHFAAYKLLGGDPDSYRHSLSRPQQLACLAQRIPIDLSETYTSQISDQEKEQVHSHLRVLLKVEDNLETMVTTSPSEPILSEAAYFLMTSRAVPRFSPAQALQNILDGFAVNKGELGELLVALLFIIARDNAVGVADNLGLPPKNRWCLLPDLLSSLFRPPSDGSVADIKISFGSRFSKKNVQLTGQCLADKFKESRVYYTHFIKAQEQKVVQVEYLMRLMARGAALLCAAGQPGVDGIIPFLLKGDDITRDNIGIIMFQVKNDRRYTDTPDPGVFSAMDPRTISGLADVPVIRLFFALAANSPALKLVSHTRDDNDKVWEAYTAYDFWVAGFSPDVLAPIIGDSSTWSSILQVSKRWENTYTMGLIDSKRLRMTMNPGAAASAEFWECWCHPPVS